MFNNGKEVIISEDNFHQHTFGYVELTRTFANTQHFHKTQRCQWACGEKNILLNLTFRKHVQNVRLDTVCFGMVVQAFREILMLPSLVHYPEDVDSRFSEVEPDLKTSSKILLSYKLILLLPSLLVEYGNICCEARNSIIDN